MAARVIPTPQRPEIPEFSPGPDFIRGTQVSEVLPHALTGHEKRIFTQAKKLGVPRDEVLDAILLDDLRRELTKSEAREIRSHYDESDRRGRQETFTDVLSDLVDDGSPSFAKGPASDVERFLGDDRIFGRGGDDYIADLRGSNLVMTDEGNDRVLLGRGSDRVFDRGGDNRIDDRGGNNSIFTGDGDDLITTGRGADHINAFDGRNVIDAGAGRNFVRGGNGYDSISVGTGDDFVEVRNGTAGEWERFDLPALGIDRYKAHNFVEDVGGSDNIRATGSSREPDVKDTLFNGNDLILSDFGGEVFGNDLIEVGGGDNIVIDLGGNNRVRTLDGDDIIFTSLVSGGRDQIRAGAGNDVINPGRGRDFVNPGPGEDFIFLENDGKRDRIEYLKDDRSGDINTTDVITGFDSRKDRIDVSTLDATFDNLLLFKTSELGRLYGDEKVEDFLVAWDMNRDGKLNEGDFLTCIFADISGKLGKDAFVFAEDTLV